MSDAIRANHLVAANDLALLAASTRSSHAPPSWIFKFDQVSEEC